MSACEEFTRRHAQNMGGKIWTQNDDGWIYFSLPLFGKNYTSWRKTWEEVASALAVLADVRSEMRQQFENELRRVAEEF